MHLFTEYALSTGSKIKTPKLLEKFFPLNTNKFITFQSSSGMPSKNYDYFSDVLDLLRPILNKYNIDIIQLGGKDDENFPHVIRLCGLTNLAQSTYIIKRGLLHFGNDSSLVHIASTLDKPIVACYGISPKTVCGPYFNSKSRAICLEPQFPEGQKFSYNPQENPKMVNTIKPEQLARAAIDLLGLKEEISISSLYFGKDYKKQVIKLIPDHILHHQQFQNQIIHIRADLLWNPDGIYGNASQRPVIIVTNQPLDLNILKQVKINVKNVIYLLYIKNKERDLEFIKQLHDSGINYILLSHEQENLAQFKFDYLDFNQVHYCPINTINDVKNKDQIGANTYFKTNKFILSNGKIFLSQAHWEADSPMEQGKLNKIINNDIFFRDVDYHYYFNQEEVSKS